MPRKKYRRHGFFSPYRRYDLPNISQVCNIRVRIIRAVHFADSSRRQRRTQLRFQIGFAACNPFGFNGALIGRKACVQRGIGRRQNGIKPFQIRCLIRLVRTFHRRNRIEDNLARRDMFARRYIIIGGKANFCAVEIFTPTDLQIFTCVRRFVRGDIISNRRRRAAEIRLQKRRFQLFRRLACIPHFLTPNIIAHIRLPNRRMMRTFHEYLRNIMFFRAGNRFVDRTERREIRQIVVKRRIVQPKHQFSVVRTVR